MHGIKMQEGAISGSSTNYDLKGKSGESGAYQWMPDTWKTDAQQYLGDPNAPMTPDNQNKVAYSDILAEKKAGKTPAEIVAGWNTGTPSVQAANKIGSGTNSSGAQYDAPAYVNNVIKYATAYAQKNKVIAPPPQKPAGVQLQSFAGSMSPSSETEGSTAQTSNESTFNDAMGAAKALATSEVGFGQDIAAAIGGNEYARDFQNLSKADQSYASIVINEMNQAKSQGKDTGKYLTMLKNFNTSEGKSLTDMFPALLKSNEQVLGDAAGTALDIVGGGELAGAAEARGAAEGATLGQRVLKGAGTGAAFGAGAGLAGGAQQNQSVGGLAKSTVVGAAAGAAAGSLFEGALGKKATTKADALEAVSPRLTSAEAEKASTKTSKITGKVSVVPTKRTQDIADVVTGIYDKSKTFSENANRVRDAITTEAEKLKSDIAAIDHPVPKKEAAAALKNVKMPDSIVGDSQKVYNKVFAKAKSIIANNSGSVSGLLDGRKEFDNYVQSVFPNLYSSDTQTNMRVAIREIRSGWNDFIADQLPKNVDYQASLDKQSLLYDAEETLKEKAARGAPKVQGEIGTNRLSRFAKRNPKLTKGIGIGAGAIAGGILTGAGFKEGEKLLP